MAATIVCVEEYLRTSFDDGDREYIEGRLVRTHLGEVDHSDVQSSMLVYLRSHYKGFWSAVAVRVQVSEKRFHVPDVCVVREAKPGRPVMVRPPALVAEVLSPDDRAGEVSEKIEDYLRFGIPCVWVVNPETQSAEIHTSDGRRAAQDGLLETPGGETQMPLPVLFGE